MISKSVKTRIIITLFSFFCLSFQVIGQKRELWISYFIKKVEFKSYSNNSPHKSCTVIYPSLALMKRYDDASIELQNKLCNFSLFSNSSGLPKFSISKNTEDNLEFSGHFLSKSSAKQIFFQLDTGGNQATSNPNFFSLERETHRDIYFIFTINTPKNIELKFYDNDFNLIEVITFYTR